MADDRIGENETPAVPRPYPGRRQPLARNLDEIDAAWLTEMLQYRYPGVVVESMERVQLLPSHSTKLRVEVELNEVGRRAGIGRRLCLKSNWSGSFAAGDICVVEAQFYHFLRDRMGSQTPLCYYADWDDDGSNQGLIVLEDLVPRGGTFGRSAELLGVDETARSLEGLAKIHGSLWGSPLLGEQGWLQTSMDCAVDCGKPQLMGWVLTKNLGNPEFRRSLPERFLADPNRLERAYQALIVYEKAQTGPRCVVQGDCHLGNSYLAPDGNRLWIDWQLVRKGRPLRDVVYLMVGALTVAERRGWDRHLLAHYREALIATGATEVPTLDEIWEQYRRWVLFGLQIWLSYLDEWGEDAAPLRERFFRASEDLDTWELLLGREDGDRQRQK